VCRRGFDRMAEIVRNRLDGVTDPIERLHAMARGYCEFALGNPAQYRALLMSPQIAHHEASQAPSNFPDLLNSVEAAQRTEMAGFHALVGIVTEGIAAGALRADNPIDMALFLWTGVHGIVSLRLADPRMPWPPIDHQLDQYFMLIGLGILGPHPGEASFGARQAPQP
jgi:AcrR family transcriptional regulator